LQNATIAGGVAMGASADILMSPGAAVLIGGLAGALSVFGYAILGPIAQRKLKIYDTCGVHNLHGMPSVLGAIASAIVASQVFVFGDPAKAALHHGSLQWGYQLACMCITLCISIAGGIFSGWLVMSMKCVPKPKGQFLFDDSEYFEIPDVFEAGEAPSRMNSILGPMQSQQMDEFGRSGEPREDGLKRVTSIDEIIDL
jgi:ammonium transporter Rh